MGHTISMCFLVMKDNCLGQAESSGLSKTLWLNLEQIIGVQKTFRPGRVFQSMS
jgi:hypothetical protein